MTNEAAVRLLQTRSNAARRRPAGWVLVLGGSVSVVLVCAIGVYAGIRLYVRGLVAGLEDSTAEVRARCCYRLGSYPQAAEAVMALLLTETDPGVCEAAGYALQKMRARQALEVLSEVVSRLEDGAPVSKLIGYYARLGGDEVAAEIEKLAGCGRTFREMGGGVGLLELGDVRGAEILLHYAGADHEFVSAYAVDLLRRFSEPMMEMVGQPLDLSTSEGQAFSQEQLAALRAWWSERDRTRELRDFNTWTRRDDPAWHQLKRLKHAREWASRLVGLSE